MTHQTTHGGQQAPKLSRILAADEVHTSLARQVFNGLAGTMLMLAAGLIVLMVVLWKAP